MCVHAHMCDASLFAKLAVAISINIVVAIAAVCCCTQVLIYDKANK